MDMCAKFFGVHFLCGMKQGKVVMPFGQLWLDDTSNHLTIYSQKKRGYGSDRGWPNLRVIVYLFNDIVKRSLEQKY